MARQTANRQKVVFGEKRGDKRVGETKQKKKKRAIHPSTSFGFVLFHEFSFCIFLCRSLDS
jgi:hypothetical protein